MDATGAIDGEAGTLSVFRNAGWCVGLLVLGGTGCLPSARDADMDARHDAVSLAMPSRIEIVAPFTRIKSLSGGDEPDGIELLLQARNEFGNPGLMIVGTVRVELFEFLPGSAECKGRRLDRWTADLRTEADQRRYWNHLTQMYEFRLGVDLSAIPPAPKYVILVTYTTPFGEHISDEMVLSNGQAGQAGA